MAADDYRTRELRKELRAANARGDSDTARQVLDELERTGAATPALAARQAAKHSRPRMAGTRAATRP